MQRLEHAHPGSVFAVVPHFVFPDVLAARRPEVQALEARLASWEAPALARVAGTWLGQTDALLYFSGIARVINPDGSTTLTPVRYLDADGQALEKIRLDAMADALLYLRPQDSLTLIPPHSGEPDKRMAGSHRASRFLKEGKGIRASPSDRIGRREFSIVVLELRNQAH